MPSRFSWPVALFLIVALAGCDAAAAKVRGVRGPGPSPYALFERADMRTGVEFAELNSGALREQKQQYNCEDLWEGHRSCSLKVAPGMLAAIVDPEGRVVRLSLITGDTMLWRLDPARSDFVYANHLNGMRQEWNTIGPSDSVRLADLTTEFRWTDPRGRWSAAMWYAPKTRYLPREWFRYAPRELQRALDDSLAHVPDSIAITFDSAYAPLMERRP